MGVRGMQRKPHKQDAPVYAVFHLCHPEGEARRISPNAGDSSLAPRMTRWNALGMTTDRRFPKAATRFLSAAFACVVMAALLLFGLGGCASGDGVVRDSVDDYSWKELSAISAEIAAAPDEDAALAIAVSYHLTNDDGTLDGTQAKEVVLADGTAVRAVIVGFGQDTRTDGAPAGITFMLDQAISLREMNNDAGYAVLSKDDYASLYGGWAACELRGWLNGDFLDQFPAELGEAIAKVEKTSIAVPFDYYEMRLMSDGALERSMSELLQTTDDRLWLPSVSELTGISDDTAAAVGEPDGWRDMLRAEGAQYKLFADAGVAEEQASPLLARALATPSGSEAAHPWWLRSLGYSFYDVAADGLIDRYDSSEWVTPASTLQGIVPCFCV